jgi:hypothetical protein
LRIAPSPTQQSAADIELHRIARWPYRSWCEECVKGRGLGEQRGTHAGRAHEVPIVGLDYFYMTEKGLGHRSDLAYANDTEVKVARECGEIVVCVITRCPASRNVFLTSRNCPRRRLEPLDADAEEKTEFENHLVGNAIPPEYVAAIEKGFEEAVRKGPLVGAPIEGVRQVESMDDAKRWVAVRLHIG